MFFRCMFWILFLIHHQTQIKRLQARADVTVHEAQVYNVLTIFSSHMIKHVLSLFVHEKILHSIVCVWHFG